MRILIVEDDERLAAGIARGLRKHAYAVDVAPDGEEGLFLAQTNPYDLVILDVMLPRLGGVEVCRELRAGGADVPVLMLTARDAVPDRVQGLESGADDYVIKPFAFEELVARVRALLRRPRGVLPPVLAVGDLTLDTGSRRARRGGADIELTSKEYAILEYLMERAGRVVSRSDLYEHAWDATLDAFSNVIEVYIRRLRQKIDDGRDAKLIHTRRGAGYVIAEAPDPPGAEDEG